jgi:two-component system response regulator HydG
MIAGSPAMRLLLGRAVAVARSGAPVVITGEPGSGKEVVARAIHANGPRCKGPFVTAGPAGLIERLFEEARGGTLFVDDVASLSPAQQARLLLVVQDSEDPRILCAPHGDLRKAVAGGWFREDLYYRLRVFSIEVPPLRARPDDILPLARTFLPEGLQLTAAAEEALLAHSWPGNVRELQNAVRHASAFTSGREVGVELLPPEIVQPRRAPLRSLADVEREHILRTMEACDGHHAEAARALGIGRTTLWRKLNEYSGAMVENTAAVLA